MEDLRLVLEIKRGKEIVNTFENEKTNLVKLLSYMSMYSLNKKTYFKIKVARNFERNGKLYSDVEIIFNKDVETATYYFKNVPIDSAYCIEETEILNFLNIK